MTNNYYIIRFCLDREDPDHLRIIRTGLTRAEAMEHCGREDTHEKNPDGTTKWFDGFDYEKSKVKL